MTNHLEPGFPNTIQTLQSQKDTNNEQKESRQDPVQTANTRIQEVEGIRS